MKPHRRWCVPIQSRSVSYLQLLGVDAAGFEDVAVEGRGDPHCEVGGWFDCRPIRARYSLDINLDMSRTFVHFVKPLRPPVGQAVGLEHGAADGVARAVLPQKIDHKIAVRIMGKQDTAQPRTRGAGSDSSGSGRGAMPPARSGRRPRPRRARRGRPARPASDRGAVGVIYVGWI